VVVTESRAAVGLDLTGVCRAALRAVDAASASLSLLADGAWSWSAGDHASGDRLEVSLTSGDGQVLGTLAVTDAGSRTWTDRDRERLQDIAHWAVTELTLERALTAAEADRLAWRLAVDAAGVGAFEWDLVTRDLKWDDRLLELFGLDERSFGGTIEAFNERVHPEDRARVGHALQHAIDTCGEYVAEYRILTPGGEVRWIGIRAQPTYTADGTPALLSGISIDITEHKVMEEQLRDLAAMLEPRVEERTAELMAAQEALRQSQKLEAIGQLTGGVAHDFNNLLTPIIGSLDLLNRRAAEGSRDRRLTEAALQAAERAKTLVQRLLAFARRQPLTPAAVDLPALVIGISPLIGTTAGPQIELALDLAGDAPFALADANQMEMAILNLAVNARDAMPEGGRLTISVRAETVSTGHRSGLPPADYVRLGVIDTGTGMDAETRERAIEPFFSTKGVGQGTGLGLSMVHGLAMQLGGALTIASTPGAGTAIELWLPISDADLIVEVRPEIAVPLLVSGKVLLVDDEPLVRQATATMLGDLGFTVIEAASGREALAALSVHADIEVLVTDHLMPAMSGIELARTALHERPGLRTLIVSGYADIAEIADDLPRLQKPFVQADLAAAIGALR
jgi:PAS domain S-box-containing protein